MPRFYMTADVFIDRPIGEVRAFFADVTSPVLWDRSVCKVICNSPVPLEVGATFTTIGPSRDGREGKRSDYRVVAIDGDESKLELVNSPIFESAVWTMRLIANGG